jgi:hypothetical protein
VIVLLAVLSFRYSEYGAYTQFAARAHAAFLSVPLAAVALISVAYPTVARAWQDRSAIILVSCLAAIVLGWHSLGLTLWADYVRDFRTVLLSGDGYIPFEEGLMKVPLEKRRLFQRLTWGWTNPTISYLLSPKQQVSTILGARATTVWQPFDPCKLDTLPHRKFNIRPYLSAIDAKGCVGVSRPGDSDPSPD